MQTINVFYYWNEIDVQLGFDPSVGERNRVMYQRTIKMYHGVDNLVCFNIKNGDQKPVNITGFTVNFNIIDDEGGALLYTTPVTVFDPVNGIVSVTIGELVLSPLTASYYNYSLTAINQTTNLEYVLYSGANYEVTGQIELLSGAYPTFKPSIYVSLPTNSNGQTITSEVTSDTPSRQLSAHHTAQFWFQSFSGNIAVQATLDPLPANGNTSGNTSMSWATVSSASYLNQVTPSYINWDGVYTACRFLIIPVTGNVTQVLYRA